MSYIRMYRDNFIESTELEYLYINHTLKFVEYIEQIGMGDKVAAIKPEHLKKSIKYFHDNGAIQTVSTMNNHLNAIKRFFVFLFKSGIIKENIFNQIPDYEVFKQEIVAECQLKPVSERGYLDNDQIEELLDYFNCKSKKYSNMIMMGFFFKITLLVPAKRKVIAGLKVSDFSEDFDIVTVNGISIRLPRALSLDIKNELNQMSQIIKKDDFFFELFCGCKYSENVFNTPFYHALKEIGYEVPKEKDTFPVECIRNTAIVNLAIGGASLYLISQLSGLSLSGLDNLLTKYKVDIAERTVTNSLINQEISKYQFYQKL